MLTPTRDAGLEALADFVPRAGRDYARDRNHDAGVSRDNVSTLSPYLRHRLITEREVVDAVLDRHSLSSAEKFVQEVFWRTYWKGWLERHPEVWRRYRRDLPETDRTADYEAAVSGRSGIDAMDAWARELVETGYLHNHTRMWFASIWIFTLELPWQLGADFFYRNLLDGDAASNTLSWRWVAGLQTKGKTYLATRENISRYTDGRFDQTGLATVARALSEEPVPAQELSAPRALPDGGRLGLLLHEEDLSPESLRAEHPSLERVVAVAGGADVDSRSPFEMPDHVRDFTRGALDDTLARASAAFGLAATPVGTGISDVLEWASSERLDAVAVPYAPVGPVQERMLALEAALASESVALVPVRRTWDGLAWPHASRGFFPFRERIPGLVRQQRLG
jgi:deoxyribodipyrimidine photo-lyase